MAERMVPADSALLRLDAAGHALALVAVTECEGPAPTLAKVQERAGRLLASLPRFRALPQAVPFDLERPVWADDPNFDITDHVGEMALPAGGGDPVAGLVETLAAAPSVAGRPPWNLYLAKGPGSGRWLLAARLHLVLVDGLGAPDLYSCVLAPRVTPPAVAPYEAPAPAPRLVMDALRDLMTSPYEQVRMLRSTFRRVRPEPAPPPPVATHQRRLVVALDNLKAVKDGLGGSVNDVLATMAAAATGQFVDGSSVRLTIPFAVRSLSRPGQFDNQVESVEVVLPARAAKAKDHHREVAARLDRAARDNLAVGGKLLGRVAAPTPFVLLALGARACLTTDADVVLVNGPGPPATGPVFGGQSRGAHAAIPHPPGARVCITALSHAGQVSLAVSGADAAELDDVVGELSSALAALLAAAGTARP